MKIAYLVLAHNTPNHLKRLCEALSSDASRVFVHWDKRAGQGLPFECDEARVTFLKDRIPVYWGDFTQVEAQLKLLKAAYDSPEGFDRFVLLSGSDFPLRSASYIEDFFERKKGVEFMNLVQMPANKLGKPICRLTHYKLRPADSKVVNAIKKFLIKMRVMPRRRDYREVFGDLAPYGGSAWWAIGREAAAHILEFTVQNPRIVTYYKHTDIPDESYFQTILGNSEFKSKMQRSLTYTDWSAGGANPAMLTMAHMERFISEVPCLSNSAYGNSEVLFARKFSEDSDELVSMLESRNREESVRAAAAG